MPEHLPSSARDQALAWFVRLNSGDATPQQRADFRRWQAADPGHQAEFEKLAAMWGRLDMVTDPRKISRRRILKGSAGALGTIAILGAGYQAGLWDWLSGAITTGTGEIRTVTLADGSTAELDADTALSVNYAEHDRRVGLWRGRAFFTVEPDAARQFSVAAGNGVTAALGTQFVIHRTNDDVLVTVLESRVSVVTGSTSAASASTVVEAGQQVSYGTGGLGIVAASAGQSETAWRRGKLIFEDQTLTRVVSDLNRYRRGSIVLLDESLGKLRISGIFDIRNPDGVLDAIEQTLPVQAMRVTPYLVLLRSV
jgi:transmembrane sensor